MYCSLINITPIHHLLVNTIQYNTIHDNTIQYKTIQYNTKQNNTIQYNTIQYNTMMIWSIQVSSMYCSLIHITPIHHLLVNKNNTVFKMNEVSHGNTCHLPIPDGQKFANARTHPWGWGLFCNYLIYWYLFL